ncbi:hypothetical protein LCGC14_2297990 [marine sediment metagenome]|uniref:Ribonuclease HII n=1 Tax=marine sediment metagenome TaxID=412755 RepID=A0A0F9CPS3_9ZZZZ
MPNFTLEVEVRSKAGNPDLFVAGIDEVGVGPLAGPIMATAVVLGRTEKWFEYLDDSKKLTRRNRDRLYDLIVKNAMAVGIGCIDNEKIDRLGVAEARRQAVIKAYESCKLILTPYSVAAVVDDRRLSRIRHSLGGEYSVFVDKADSRSLSVAAASIMAKTFRDRYMERVSSNFPEYGFEAHKGYGTPQHLAALKEHGPCPIHRFSFAPVKNTKKTSK